MKSSAKQFRYYIEWIALNCMEFIIPLIPRALLLPIAKSLGTTAYIFDRRGRKTGIANIQSTTTEFKGISDSNAAEAYTKKLPVLYSKHV